MNVLELETVVMSGSRISRQKMSAACRGMLHLTIPTTIFLPTITAAFSNGSRHEASVDHKGLILPMPASGAMQGASCVKCEVK